MAERVVVVHPDPAQGSAITEACGHAGFDVIAFTDPVDALLHIERSVVDALVTAVRFGAGKLHGTALTLMSQHRNAALKALLIAEPRDLEEAKRVGECVPAPGDPTGVADTLGRLVGRGRSPV